MQIISNAPAYVWAILAVIVVFGLMQAKDRTISPVVVLILPIAMVAFSIWGVRSLFGSNIGPVVYWLVGSVLAVAGNHLVLRRPRNVRYDVSKGRYSIPGSWLPLLFMLAIFVANYAINVTQVLRPALLQQPTTVASWSLLLGILSGFFVARALQILRSRQAA